MRTYSGLPYPRDLFLAALLSVAASRAQFIRCEMISKTTFGQQVCLNSDYNDNVRTRFTGILMGILILLLIILTGVRFQLSSDLNIAST